MSEQPLTPKHADQHESTRASQNTGERVTGVATNRRKQKLLAVALLLMGLLNLYVFFFR